MAAKDRKKSLENIARLRRAERLHPDPEVANVREDLEEELGGTVSRSLAAETLGVSHTALNNWVDSGDVPVVISPRGRREVPIPALLDLSERVEEERSSGRRRLHTLEPVLAAARERAANIRPDPSLTAELGAADRHRLSELRSLAYHREIAPQLRRGEINEASRKISRWADSGKIDPTYARAWQEVFALPMAEIRRVINADDVSGRELRQNSPLAGLLSEPERRKILETVA